MSEPPHCKPLEWMARRLFEPRPADLKGFGGSCIRAAQVAFLTGSRFRKDLCWERSSALSFVTVVSLIPLSVLFLSMIGQSTSQVRLQWFIENKVLVFLVPDESLRESLWKILRQEIDTTAFQFNAGVNILALAGLVIAGAALLVTTERVFNKLWEVPETRNYFQKLRNFWIILTSGPLALGASLYFDQITQAGTVFGDLKTRYWVFGILYSFIVPALISFFAFAILNLVLPYTKVRLGPALLGALVSSVLWEGAKKGFYLYVQEAHKYAKFYGSLGILPVFLMWIYVTWVIILLGAEVVRSAQNRQRFALQRRSSLFASRRGSPYLGIQLLLRISRSFESGQSVPDVGEIAHDGGLDPVILGSIAGEMTQGGLLLEGQEGSGIFHLTRSPRAIRIREILEFLPGDVADLDRWISGCGEAPAVSAGSPDQPALHLFQGARKAFLEAIGDRTLGDLLVPGLSPGKS